MTKRWHTGRPQRDRSDEGWFKPAKLEDLSWHDDAACVPADPEINFFPERGEGAQAAKQVCYPCPVRQECLEWALSRPVLLPGIWGATSERERKQIRKERRQAGKAAL